MKRNLFYLLMLVCSMSVFTACSDNDEPNIPIEKELAGTYKGALDIVMNGSNLGTNIPKNISITKAGVSSINLELKDFSFGSLNFETIAIQDCAMDKYRDRYTFTGSQTLKFAAPLGECPVVVNGTIIGNKVTANLDITVSALSQTVKVVYEGAKLRGNESSEAKISNFSIEGDVVTEQPTYNESTGEITFKVDENATAEQLKLIPVFSVSPKAVVYPASGVVQDFSNGKKVVYTVIAEDGTVKEYTVSSAGSQNVLRFSFEEWENVPGSMWSNGYDKPKPTNILATSAEGAAMLILYGVKDVPVFKTEDKKEGNYAIKLVTLDTSEQANGLVPAITSGSVFTGKFDLSYLNWETFDKLDCTRFGVSYDKKPLRFKGSYKYTSGAKFLDGSAYPVIEEIKGKKDECSIQAVLYKITNDDDVLTGNNINTSDKRVAVAALKDGSDKEKFTDFDLEFNYLQAYEVGAKYKLAIVCSSSKEGDFFKGAGGSTLILDELEIIGE
ncbi:PCMD domain-containing protein [Bacteroides ovatus]|uniref:PCMD domain-containing protein n=1 Tax=Bacteroides ovatus TaxID=28116 RepID=UPI00356AF204